MIIKMTTVDEQEEEEEENIFRTFYFAFFRCRIARKKSVLICALHGKKAILRVQKEKPSLFSESLSFMRLVKTA